MKSTPEQHEYEFFLGIGLPKKENEFFSGLKRQFHPEGHLSSPPHITVKTPFMQRDEKYLFEKLASWVRYQDPFSLEFGLIGSFQHKHYASVHLIPKSSEKLKELERSLSEKIRFLPSMRQYVPHLTVAQQVPFDQLKQIKTEVRELKLSLKMDVLSITLYRHQPHEPWEVYNEFFFGESNTRI